MLKANGGTVYMLKTEAETLEQVHEVIQYLKKRIKIDAVVLFGSALRGTMDEWSDIDLAIFSEDVSHWSFEEEINMMVDVQAVCPNSIEPHFYPAEALKEARPTNFWGHILETGRRIA